MDKIGLTYERIYWSNTCNGCNARNNTGGFVYTPPYDDKNTIFIDAAKQECIVVLSSLISLNKEAIGMLVL